MGFTQPLSEMTTKEKLRMMEQIWDDLCRNAEDIPSPAWHAPILAEREARVQRGEEQIDSWEVAKRKIRESLA